MAMKAFPMDSQVTEFGDDGLPVYDRAFDSTDLREIYKTYFSNGYFADKGDSMQVFADTGLTGVVKAGKVNIQGTLGFMDEDATITFAAADKQNPRVDTVVARLDLSLDKREIGLYVKQGIPAVSPTIPELTRDDTVYELGLANVRIDANAAAVTQAKITDTRLDTARCGVVNPFAKLETDGLFAQITAIINNANQQTEADINRLNKEITDSIAAADAKIDSAVAEDKAALDRNIGELDTATNEAVQAMRDALEGVDLSQVWRLANSADSAQIPNGADLNDGKYWAVGSYFKGDGAVSVSNIPNDLSASSLFALLTVAPNLSNDTERIQIMFAGSTDTGGAPGAYFRNKASLEWVSLGGDSGLSKKIGGTLATRTAENLSDFKEAGQYYISDIGVYPDRPIPDTRTGYEHTVNPEGAFSLTVSVFQNNASAIMQRLEQLSKKKYAYAPLYDVRRLSVDGGATWTEWEYSGHISNNLNREYNNSAAFVPSAEIVSELADHNAHISSKDIAPGSTASYDEGMWDAVFGNPMAPGADAMSYKILVANFSSHASGSVGAALFVLSDTIGGRFGIEAFVYVDPSEKRKITISFDNTVKFESTVYGEVLGSMSLLDWSQYFNGRLA